ncbi:UNVERIFIED_CONTAM: Disease resistance protein RPS2 [Sesamum angustifolium]|uniref:Disease resistance protein RPS2 n=1 Tax=Sesamum angustifolium TaxID=2727405 RepID=A0AAW2N901_9LAMI
MDFVTPLVTIFSSLIVNLSGRVTTAEKLHKSTVALETALEELTEVRDDLKKQVDRAESLGLIRTNQVKGWLDRVEKVEAEGKGNLEVDLADGLLLVPVVEMPSRPAVGLELMLDKVRQLLSKETVGTIGLYGMGGVGKTTLLKCINNGFLYSDHDFDVMIWEGLDLEKIGIPIPSEENRSKVVFTTRSLEVCSFMDADYKLKVEFLNEKESWKLFQQKAGGSEILNSPLISAHAHIIVRKCGGLPLALVTIGRAMASKKTEEEWRYAVEVLNKTPSEVRGMEDVFTLLKFSYDNLDNDILRSCLLYCSLFPGDYFIEKEQLIEYWVGEGFLDCLQNGNLHIAGHAIIGALKVACFLETGAEESQVKIHDVVRSFALWIASENSNNEKFIMLASEGLSEAPCAESWKEAERISLLDNEITDLSEIPTCPNLSTLLLQWNNGLSRISDGFFQHMPVLRVLDLSFTSIKELPRSICKLSEIHHLDLSGKS